MPAVAIGARSTVAPATPTTRPAVDTMPSLAPSTPARSQFSRWDRSPPCGSGWGRTSPEVSEVLTASDMPPSSHEDWNGSRKLRLSLVVTADRRADSRRSGIRRRTMVVPVGCSGPRTAGGDAVDHDDARSERPGGSGGPADL